MILAYPAVTVSFKNIDFTFILRMQKKSLEHTCKQIESVHHGLREAVRLVLAAEVETINLAIISPLVECRRRLIVLEAFQNRAVDHNLQTVHTTDYSISSWQMETQNTYTYR